MTAAVLTIPATQRLREGAYGVLVAACESLSAAALTNTEPERGSRDRLLRAWALLERIGWHAGDEQPVTLGTEHALAVAEALENIGRLLVGWIQETDFESPRRDEYRTELHDLRRLQRIAKRAGRQVALSGAG